MKTTALAASAIIAILVLGAATVTFAHAGFGLGAGSNSTQSTHSSDNATTTHTGENDNETENQNNQGQNDGGAGGHFNLTAGTTLTFANLTGHWVAFTHTGNMTNHTEDGTGVEDNFAVKTGNATGSFTFTVKSTSGGDFNLTITSGKFTINGTTYTVSGGSVALNEGDETGFGMGTASGGATFTIHIAGIHGNTTSSAQVGAIKLDVTVGKSVYLVILGSGDGVGEDMQD